MGHRGERPSTSKSVDTLMYSDGLAAFSVFIEEHARSRREALISRSGATVAVSEVINGGADRSRSSRHRRWRDPDRDGAADAHSIRYVRQ